ncbi:hypothetical protein ACP90_21870 [Labrenzia sp. CP4]|jgi:transcriptional regulator with XRE-family HTH domain|uniref:helix-turn-helix domain-containing protein n=1 Tax=Labrenzia sp. CP4 TaxID=1674922 RepID=UPI00078E0EDF|nr:helix-turn-helix transcriptional regulator [Labrenzia sp. CP4]AMN54605.1 hypothetical protein ACP90_21870 [Labrenzia sp. CP4]
MISMAQLRAARALIGISQADLARRASLSLPTIKRMETMGPERSTAANVEAVRRALDAAGVEFIPENGGGAGVRLKTANVTADTAARP